MRALRPLQLSLVFVALHGCKTSPPTTTSAKSGAESSTPALDPAGRKFEAWLAALNAGDRAGLERSRAGARDPQMLASMDMELSQISGGFDIHHVKWAAPTERVVLIRGRKTGNWRCLRFAVESDPPHNINLTLFGPADPPSDTSAADEAFAPFDGKARRDVVDALIRELKRAYVFPERAAAIESELRQKQSQGAYDKLAGKLEFGRAITQDLQNRSNDRHLRLEVSCMSPQASTAVMPSSAVAAPPSGGAPDGPLARSGVIGETRRLDGHIAYVAIPSFDATVERAGDEIAKTMTEAADARALILDLRGNGGGEEELVRFVASYLFGNEPVRLTTMYDRTGNKTEDVFTEPNVPGTKFGAEKPVFILTGRGTFSGAEAFAYNLQALKRAVIVGEATGGGAGGGAEIFLAHGFSAFIPERRSINPITKTNWQGVGVKPDVEVRADKALETAHNLARDRVSSNPKK